jgi:uncharacterized membrane protein YgcG
MPSTEATIQTEISSHQYAKADADLRAVISAKPDSAKAHYWLGQVLGYEGRAQDGLAELARAKAIDPSLGFSNADSFHRVESALQASATHASTAHAGGGLGSNLGPSIPSATSAHVGTVATPQPNLASHDSPANNSGVSSMQILIGIAIVVALFMFFRRRQSGSAPPASYPGNGAAQGPVPPGYGYPQNAAPPSSGIGSVVAGAAGGFLLGEMLGHSRDAGATTIVHDVVHDAPTTPDADSNYGSDFDPGSNDGGSFGGDGGGFDSGGGGDF